MSVAFAPDGQTVATAGDDRTIKLWDAATGKELAMLAGHADTVYSVAFSPDGKQIASASMDTTARRWDVAARKDTPTDPDPNRLSDVIPVTGDRVVVCTNSGPVMVLPVRDDRPAPEDRREIDRDIALLGDSVFRTREAAHARLAKRGTAALPALRVGLREYRDQEVLARLRRLVAAAEKAHAGFAHPTSYDMEWRAA